MRQSCLTYFGTEGDGSTLMSSGADHTIRFWDVSSGTCLRTIRRSVHWVGYSLILSPESNSVAIATDHETIDLYDIDTGKCLKSFRADRPYERMNITGVTGISEAQRASLKALGAIEDEVA
jgi:WD40 repeat protein